MAASIIFGVTNQFALSNQRRFVDKTAEDGQLNVLAKDVFVPFREEPVNFRPWQPLHLYINQVMTLISFHHYKMRLAP
jgi:hypothetical protein